MDYSSWLFPAFFAAIAGSFVFRRYKYGSWTGAFLSRRIQRTVGEVTLSKSAMARRVMRVDVLEGSQSEDPMVGLTITSKAAFGASMMPFKITRQQALELSTLLLAAAK